MLEWQTVLNIRFGGIINIPNQFTVGRDDSRGLFLTVKSLLLQ